MNLAFVTSPYLSEGLGIFLALMGGFNLWQARKTQPAAFAAAGRGADPGRAPLARNVMSVAWGIVLASGIIIAGLELYILL